MRGWVWVRSGRFIPCFAMAYPSVVAAGQVFRVVLKTGEGIDVFSSCADLFLNIVGELEIGRASCRERV